jgi:hypothetical protein
LAADSSAGISDSVDDMSEPTAGTSGAAAVGGTDATDGAAVKIAATTTALVAAASLRSMKSLLRTPSTAEQAGAPD